MRSAVPYDSGVFPPPQANCRSRRCCNASPLSSTYVAYVSHVHFWHGREQRWRHVRVFPYTWVEEGGHDIARRLRASLCLSLFFWKEKEREKERETTSSWTNFSVIHDDTGTRDIFHPAHPLPGTCNYCSLFGSSLYKVPLFLIDHFLPLRNKLLHC